MKVAILFSGGKDSVFATFWALTHGFDPILVTIKPPEYSMMFHHPNIVPTSLQASALQLPQIFVETTEENWREKLVHLFKDLGVAGIVAGAVASEYQKRRIDSIGEELGIPTYAPLWHKDESILKEMLENFTIFVTAVSAEGLGPEFLAAGLEKLVNCKKPHIHPFLEGGEGETFVADAPFFTSKLIITKWKKNWDGARGIADIEEIKLEEK